MKKTAIYIRCAKDVPYLDLEAQLKACVEKQKDLQYVNCYVDVGYSGCSIDRPALQELIVAIEAGNVDAVVVKQLASLSRNPENLGSCLNCLIEPRPQFTSSGENLFDVYRLSS